jgi:hypothetical protein
MEKDFSQELKVFLRSLFTVLCLLPWLCTKPSAVSLAWYPLQLNGCGLVVLFLEYGAERGVFYFLKWKM